MAKEKNEVYDTIIIGAGPAGMTAAIYAIRYQLKVLIISKDIGGVANLAHKIENWPGIVSITGPDLMQNFKIHLEALGVKIIQEEVVKLAEGFEVSTSGGKTFKSKTLILALGTVRRKLNIPGEDEFIGKGVSYCFTCDGPMFRDKIVCVVGGSNSAAMAALLLAEYAKKVYLIYRKEALRADPILIERVNKNKKIQAMYNTEITKILGTKFVEKIVLNNGKEMPMEGIFIEAGGIPSTDLAKELGVKLNEHSSITVDDNMQTNIPGVYAAGDITNTPLDQVVTACADGAKAAYSVFNYFKQKPA
ncbi:MAG: FAD-dependent oxidoreductase [Nanoarchaeota archaeon]|nr:FAD-dependent oxidoreductase [Nanoarchaeota archaeon]